MGIFSYLNSKPIIRGLVGYHGLSEWWLSEFSDEERNHIVNTYTPMGSGEDILLKDNIDWSSSSVVHFLYNLAGWFNNKRDRYLAIKILKKAEELISDDTPILDIHFFYQHIIQIHYSNRLIDSNSLDKSINACEKQIEIASQVANAMKVEFNDDFFPRHMGYSQLAIIKKKEKKYQEVIDICSKAIKEGWRGDWEDRIEWSKKKLNKDNGSR